MTGAHDIWYYKRTPVVDSLSEVYSVAENSEGFIAAQAGGTMRALHLAKRLVHLENSPRPGSIGGPDCE